MNVIVVDDTYAFGDAVERALTADAAHDVTWALHPAALRDQLDRATFDLAFVDMHFGRASPDSGLVALRHLDETRTPAVIYHAEEENRVLYLLAAFRFYDPVWVMPKTASARELRHLADLIAGGAAPAPNDSVRRYRGRRAEPHVLDRLIGNGTDLRLWQALSRHSSRLDIARAAPVNPGTVDKFLANRYPAMREVQTRVLDRGDADEGAGSTARARLAPMHAFAITHGAFFRDAELVELIKRRDRRR